MSGGFDQTFISEVRSRSDILSVVGDYVTLRKAGTSWKGLCPFHGEKTPSFHVHPERQYFYCFGCQAGGDVIRFVSDLNGFSFPEAIRHLANRAGLAVPERSPDRSAGDRTGGDRGPQRPAKEAMDVFFQVNRLATRFFVETLASEAGARARAYLAKRGVEPTTAARFELGCAPDRWDGLATYLAREGADLQAAEILGLVVRRNGPGHDARQGHYDRFRNRLMFPIRSLAGEVLGFSGRDLGDSTLLAAVADPDRAPVAKYVNSPESPVYTKGDQLYGLFEARQSLRSKDRAILVEGNLDLVRLHQAGFSHAVAPLGTALTGAQLRKLKRFAQRITTLYDGDKAGREAARKAVHLALAEGALVEVAVLPEGVDPDSFVAEAGPEALAALLERATPGFEHLLDEALQATRGSSSAQGARATIERLAPVLADVGDPASRALLEGKLATVLGVSVGLVRDVIRTVARRVVGPGVVGPGGTRSGGTVQPPAGPGDTRSGVVAQSPAGPGGLRSSGAPPSSGPPRNPGPVAPMPPRELRLLALLVLAPEVRPVFIGRDGLADVTHAAIRDAIDAVLAADAADPGGVMASLPDGPARAWLFARLPEAVRPAQGQALPELDLLMRGLRSEAIVRRVAALRRDEQRASLTLDETRAMRLMRDRLELERQLEELRAVRG